jgi:glycerol-3-phosphate O-acyltransferase 3/4
MREKELASLQAKKDVINRLHKSTNDFSFLALIKRQWSSKIDRKLQASDVDTESESESIAGDFIAPPPKSHTIDVLINDSLEFVSAGIESIIEDEVTSRFNAAQLASWNLLSRNRPFVSTK